MKRFRLKYTGGIFGFVVIMVLALTIVMIPAAIIVLINEIEVIEVPNL